MIGFQLTYENPRRAELEARIRELTEKLEETAAELRQEKQRSENFRQNAKKVDLQLGAAREQEAVLARKLARVIHLCSYNAPHPEIWTAAGGVEAANEGRA